MLLEKINMVNKKLSVVIPTLQKNIELLTNLIKILDNDDSVSEIILIDNSCKGFSSECKKLRVIVPKENLYVNPSWNLGVKEAKEDIVALLNDDISIASNFCTKIVNQMTPDMGCIGYHVDYIEETHGKMPIPEDTEVRLEKTSIRCKYWGIAIFFYKTSYSQIPEELKIYCGDDWIFLQNKKNKRHNYHICGQKIYHYGSLSSKTKSLNPIGDRDRKLYRKLTRKWWQYIFNFEFVFRGYHLTFCGLEGTHHYSKKH